MSIKSMTGFARVQGSRGPLTWHWEIRSVNGRGLDMRTRLPPGFEDLDPDIRKRAAEKFARGSLNITLIVRREGAVAQVRINPDALRDVMASIELLTRDHGAAPPRADGILALRGVLEPVETVDDETETAAQRSAILADCDAAFNAMIVARQEEGARLRDVLLATLATIMRLAKAVEDAPARQPDAIRARLTEQVARIFEASAGMDETRLYQEAALLAVRGDVEEELKRLDAHIASAHELLDKTEPVGRRLDFLAQEFNREANTLCSKSNDKDITRLGLELKAAIDQMREQIQNIE